METCGRRRQHQRFHNRHPEDDGRPLDLDDGDLDGARRDANDDDANRSAAAAGRGLLSARRYCQRDRSHGSANEGASNGWYDGLRDVRAQRYYRSTQKQPHLPRAAIAGDFARSGRLFGKRFCAPFDFETANGVHACGPKAKTRRRQHFVEVDADYFHSSRDYDDNGEVEIRPGAIQRTSSRHSHLRQQPLPSHAYFAAGIITGRRHDHAGPTTPCRNLMEGRTAAEQSSPGWRTRASVPTLNTATIGPLDCSGTSRGGDRWALRRRYSKRPHRRHADGNRCEFGRHREYRYLDYRYPASSHHRHRAERNADCRHAAQGRDREDWRGWSFSYRRGDRQDVRNLSGRKADGSTDDGCGRRRHAQRVDGDGFGRHGDEHDNINMQMKLLHADAHQYVGGGRRRSFSSRRSRQRREHQSSGRRRRLPLTPVHLSSRNFQLKDVRARSTSVSTGGISHVAGETIRNQERQSWIQRRYGDAVYRRYSGGRRRRSSRSASRSGGPSASSDEAGKWRKPHERRAVGPRTTSSHHRRQQLRSADAAEYRERQCHYSPISGDLYRREAAVPNVSFDFRRNGESLMSPARGSRRAEDPRSSSREEACHRGRGGLVEGGDWGGGQSRFPRQRRGFHDVHQHRGRRAGGGDSGDGLCGVPSRRGAGVLGGYGRGTDGGSRGGEGRKESFLQPQRKTSFYVDNERGMRDDDDDDNDNDDGYDTGDDDEDGDDGDETGREEKRRTKGPRQKEAEQDPIKHFNWYPGQMLTPYLRVLGLMGDGTFGRVLSCYDSRSNRTVAVKVVRDVERYTAAAKIEAQILEEVRDADPARESRCVEIIECFTFSRHFCIVTEPLGLSLLEFLTRNRFRGYFLADIRSIARQCLIALDFMSKIGLTHTDLKPENILLADNSFEWVTGARPELYSPDTTETGDNASRSRSSFGNDAAGHDHHRHYEDGEDVADSGRRRKSTNRGGDGEFENHGPHSTVVGRLDSTAVLHGDFRGCDDRRPTATHSGGAFGSVTASGWREGDGMAQKSGYHRQDYEHQQHHQAADEDGNSSSRRASRSGQPRHHMASSGDISIRAAHMERRVMESLSAVSSATSRDHSATSRPMMMSGRKVSATTGVLSASATISSATDAQGVGAAVDDGRRGDSRVKSHEDERSHRRVDTFRGDRQLDDSGGERAITCKYSGSEKSVERRYRQTRSSLYLTTNAVNDDNGHDDDFGRKEMTERGTGCQFFNGTVTAPYEAFQRRLPPAGILNHSDNYLRNRPHDEYSSGSVSHVESRQNQDPDPHHQQVYHQHVCGDRVVRQNSHDNDNINDDPHRHIHLHHAHQPVLTGCKHSDAEEEAHHRGSSSSSSIANNNNYRNRSCRARQSTSLRRMGLTRRPRDCRVKIIDFGSATFENESHSSLINTRQYRAPEVILDIGWSMASDMWSLGCILIELYTGNLLFKTHEHMEHLAMMEKIVGPFPQKMLDAAMNTEGRKYLNRRTGRLDWPEGRSSDGSLRRVRECKSLKSLTLPRHAMFVDFVKSLLHLDPASRPLAHVALMHPFLHQDIQE